MDTVNQVLTTLFLLCFGIYCINTQGIQNAKDLRTYIFTTNAYDSKVRPIDNQTFPINVYVSFYLLNLNALDEVTETMTTTGYLYVSWQDEQLDWNTNDYGGITTSFWPQGDVWKPDVALKNSAVQYKPLGDSSLNVEVDNTGLVIWQPFQLFVSTCSVSITNFPFDIQNCQLVFVAWSYSKDEVMLLGDSNRGIDLSQYEKNPSWDILSVSWSISFNTEESSITFKVQLKRKPLYVILSIVLPILLLSILNIFTFALPCDGGEKAGYSVTIFLAFAVFLTIVEQTLPANSESVAIFSVYVILMTFMSTVITVIALIENRVSAWDENETPIPGWLIKIANINRYIPPCKKRGSSNKVEELEKSKTDFRENAVDDGKIGEKEHTWKTVINGVDLFCFIVFTIFALLGNLLFLVITSASTAQ